MGKFGAQGIISDIFGDYLVLTHPGQILHFIANQNFPTPRQDFSPGGDDGYPSNSISLGQGAKIISFDYLQFAQATGQNKKAQNEGSSKEPGQPALSDRSGKRLHIKDLLKPLFG